MFDIGWQELALIAVVTLVVVGPKDLPKVMRAMGDMAAKGRRAWLALEHQIEGIEAEAKRLEGDDDTGIVKDPPLTNHPPLAGGSKILDPQETKSSGRGLDSSKETDPSPKVPRTFDPPARGG